MYFKAMGCHDNSQSCVDEVADILGYYTLYSGKQLPMFLKSVTASNIWVQQYKNMLIPEVEGITLFRNFGQIVIVTV